MGYLLLHRARTDAAQILCYRDWCKCKLAYVYVCVCVCVCVSYKSANKAQPVINPGLNISECKGIHVFANEANSVCVFIRVSCKPVRLWIFVYRFIRARAFQDISVTISVSLSTPITLWCLVISLHVSWCKWEGGITRPLTQIQRRGVIWSETPNVDAIAAERKSGGKCCLFFQPCESCDLREIMGWSVITAYSDFSLYLIFECVPLCN